MILVARDQHGNNLCICKYNYYLQSLYFQDRLYNMPAKNLSRVNEEGIYAHIYNKGIEQRLIFNDEKDYEVFLGFLKDYLTPPKDANSIKTDFKIRGRTFKGTPHQPKNYFNAVDLIAYSLIPDHFHLILHQKTRGSLESFIRSLCTRYSMYFNKKYHHSGTLFEGPYKSATVEAGLRLSHLSRYLHFAGSYSSYPEYLGLRKTEWVKPEAILGMFNDKDTYKDFVEKDHPDQNLLLERTTIDNASDHLERRQPTSNKEVRADQHFNSHSRLPVFLGASIVIFLLLLGYGVKNIEYFAAKNYLPVPSPAVLGKTQKATSISPIQIKPQMTETTSSAKLEATSAASIEDRHKTLPKAKTTLIIKTNDGGTRVNIRQKPTTNSKRISKAKNGDRFELISLDSGWYGIKLHDGSTGFISAQYAVMEEKNK